VGSAKQTTLEEKGRDQRGKHSEKKSLTVCRSPDNGKGNPSGQKKGVRVQKQKGGNAKWRLQTKKGVFPKSTKHKREETGKEIKKKKVKGSRNDKNTGKTKKKSLRLWAATQARDT